ncbi:MAG: (acid phosphatase) superfamily protein [Rickettsiaceae bacterium]|jgi:lipid A 4'-phosphatase|nr:(acid phosphatase) superfamily protein [Rickettsiaceae bacterium]
MFNKTINYIFIQLFQPFSLIRMLIIVMVSTISLIFIIFPESDIVFSKLFYSNESGFFLGKHLFFRLLYDIVPLITKLLVGICVFGIILDLISKRNLKVLSTPLIYLLLTAALGPGLLVNTILKDNFGRPRPSQIVEFGGDKIFTGPLRISAQCRKNCSFTSGHAAMAFYITSFAYIAPSQFSLIIYFFGILFGTVVGLARIAQGGHFLSDVFFSGLFILILNHLLYKLYQKFIISVALNKNILNKN